MFITSESAERLGKNCATNSLISPLERSETERKGPRAPEAKLGKRNSGSETWDYNRGGVNFFTREISCLLKPPIINIKKI